MRSNERFADWVRLHSTTVDLALVALVLAAFEMPAFDPYRHAGGPVWPLWGVVVAVPLVWRRRVPITVLAVSLAGAVGALLTRTGPDWGGLSQMAVLFGPALAMANAAASVPADRSRRLAVASSGAVVATMAGTRSGTPDVIIGQVAVMLAASLAGEAIRARRNEMALLHDRIKQRAERAAADERTRIARELHDVVAHQLTVIAVHAGAVRLSAGDGVAGLAVIEEASRQALSDLRLALGVLRSDQQVGGVAPQPSLDQLDRLADRLRGAGLTVELTTIGDLSEVPMGIGVSAYRIVQEALTNVLKHAGRVATSVRVASTPAELRLDIHNERPTVDQATLLPGGGEGLIGMRERVAAYGGWLDAGALPSGGFRLTARLPLP